jgi:hypothetical protein
MTAEVLTQSDYSNWSLNQLSRAFGIARETVAKRLADSNVKPSGSRRGHAVYSVKDAATAILLPQSTSTGMVDNPDMLAPSDRRHWFASENDRIKLEKEMGMLVSVEDCRQQIVEVISVALPVLDGLADELERDFDLSPTIVGAIEERIDAVRHKWADKLEEVE